MLICIILKFSFMFSELDNADVLFRLGDPPRIALLTGGYPGLYFNL